MALKIAQFTSSSLLLQTIYELDRTEYDYCCFLQIDLKHFAFDNICHGYLWDILDHISVGDTFLTSTKLCYQETSSQIIINSELTKKIKIKSTVRQGCPLSILLFVISMESLFRHITLNNNIRGYFLLNNLNSEIKYLSYADDITLILCNTDSINQIKPLFLDFEVSGTCLNPNKSKGLWIKSSKVLV